MRLVSFITIYLVLTTDFIHSYENLALHKETWQSKQYNPGESTFHSSNAVDGLKSDLGAWGGQCVVSAEGFKTATWWVNLTSIQSIHDIRIYYRTDNTDWDDASNGYPNRFLGFYIYISNTTNRLDAHTCFHDTNYTRATIPPIVNITCPVHGQYVIYYNERPQDAERAAQFSRYAFNELCEVEVYGCNETGVFGPNCSLPCLDINCRYCHIETGACQGCKPGYKGHQCELACSAQFYGELCSKTCGNCSNGYTCHHVNGSCTNGCDVGVYGEKCQTPCPVGWHGNDCSQMCNCDECDRFSGQCTSPCKSGWKGLFCKDECSGGGYGQACEQRCGACLGYKQCHHINGSCLERCDAGFEGDLCKTGCSSGKFGVNCEQNCNENCGEPFQCNRATGECERGCQPGWEGLQCEQVCKQNKYGENCSNSCGFCQDSNCHHINGSCPGKCLNGYKGTLCNEVCKAGFYGENCKNECSLFCKSSRDCNHVTGHCNEGCIGGWQGAMCLQVAEKKDDADCLSRFYGVLAALCVSLITNTIFIAYICIYRWRGKEKPEKLAHKVNKETKATAFNMNIISSKNDEDDKNEYQELGELPLPSVYDQI